MKKYIIVILLFVSTSLFGTNVTIQQIPAGDLPPAISDTLEWQTAGGGNSYFSTLQELFNGAALCPAAGAVSGADKFLVTQSGVAKAQTFTALQTAFGAGGTLPLSGYGTVTSVGLTVPSWLSVSNSPVATAGTIAVSSGSQSAGLVLASPGLATGGFIPRQLNAAHLANAPATSSVIGAIQLTGDFGGTATSPLVAALQGIILSPTPPTAGQVLTASSTSAAGWAAAAGGGLSNPLGAGSLGTASLQLVTAGDGLWQEAAHTVDIQSNSLRVARFSSVASSVNNFSFISSATTTALEIAAIGTDSSIGIKITPKGNANILLNTTGWTQFGGTTSAFPGILPLTVGGVGVLTVTDAAGGIGRLKTTIIEAASGSYASDSATVRLNGAGNSIDISNGSVLTASSTGIASGAKDTGISRAAPGVWAFGNSAAADTSAWFNYGGTSRVAADLTNSTATMAVMTGLSATLKAGRIYLVRMIIKGVNSTATEGLQFDFNGGTATMTDFWIGAGILASGGTDVIGTNISTSLAGVINFTTFTGESVIIFEGYIKCNAAGTFIPRFAENTSVTGTVTVRKGTNMVLTDTP